MLTRLYTRCNYDSDSLKFLPTENKTRSFENTVLSYFQQTRPECSIENDVTSGRQKEIDCFSVDGSFNHCNTVFEAMGCFFETRPSLSDNEIMRGIEKKEQDQMRKEYNQQNRYKIFEKWECNVWELYRTDATVKNRLRSNFPLSATSQRRTAHAKD